MRQGDQREEPLAIRPRGSRAIAEASAPADLLGQPLPPPSPAGLCFTHISAAACGISVEDRSVGQLSLPTRREEKCGECIALWKRGSKDHRFCGAQGLAPQGFFPVAAHGLAFGAQGFFAAYGFLAAQGFAPYGLAAAAEAR
jgi:hypothetical protein